MNIEIIMVWESRYEQEERTNFIPPLTAAHLAALTPKDVNVSVRHEQVSPIDYKSNSDVVALSFMTGFANHAYEIADRFRTQGRTVVLGGPHPTLCPNEAAKHGDAVVVGEAEYTWSKLINDIKSKRLEKIYKTDKMHDLKNLPIPRYDLMEESFFLNHYIQATRGCPYNCSFCSLKSLDKSFRMRPIEDVIRDIICYEGRNFIQNKVIWFWDDNLIGNKEYAKELFRKMIPLKKWWLSQASIDIVNDIELVELAAKSGCVGLFIGIETFTDENIVDMRKYQNKVNGYEKAISILHKHGIGVMGGLMIGFDNDTYESIHKIPDYVNDLKIDVPFLNILTPLYGTKIYDLYKRQGRIVTDDWSMYTGYNIVYKPNNMTS